MEQVMWLEVMADHHTVLSRHRLDGKPLRIGRDYTNDIILDDPYVAPRHATIERGADGVLAAVDAGTVNGLRDEESERQDRLRLDGPMSFRVGKTLLRVRSADFRVPPERALHLDATWLSVVALVGFLLVHTLMVDWLRSVEKEKLIHYVGIAIGPVIGLLIWTSFWAVLSRIFGGAARFATHLKIGAVYFLLSALLSEAADAAAFGFSWPSVARYEYMPEFAVLGFFCFLHMRAIRATKLLWKGLGAGLVVTTICAVIFFYLEENPATIMRSDYITKIEPPGMRLVPARPAGEFWAQVGDLQPRLDAARKEDPPQDGGDSRRLEDIFAH